MREGRDLRAAFRPLPRADGGLHADLAGVEAREARARAAPSTGGRLVAGEAGADGCGLGRGIASARGRQAVDGVRGTVLSRTVTPALASRLPRRQACRTAGRHRGTSRYRPATPAAEDGLTRAVLARATAAGRWGERRAVAGRGLAGWQGLIPGFVTLTVTASGVARRCRSPAGIVHAETRGSQWARYAKSHLLLVHLPPAPVMFRVLAHWLSMAGTMQ